MTIVVSGNSRYLTQDAQPFFWVADTAWSFTSRLTLAEARTYLDNRAAKGFNVVVCWLVASWHYENKAGDPPFDNNLNNDNNTVLNNNYWTLVEDKLDYAATKGINVVIELGYVLRDNAPQNSGIAHWGTHSQHRAKAYNVGYRIANRLRTRSNVYFGTGGDTHPLRCSRVGDANCANNGAQYVELTQWMAAGIADGRNNDTYSESGTAQSAAPIISHHIGNEDLGIWTGNTRDFAFSLAYDSTQSGRASRFSDTTYLETESNYAAAPTRPTWDYEGSYEGSTPEDEASYKRRGWHVRQHLYCSLFAGSFGVSYGHGSVWQMYQPGFTPRGSPSEYWYDVLDSEGAVSVGHLVALMKSRPEFTWGPSTALFTTSAGSDYTRIQAILDATGKYGMVYTTNGRAFTADLSQISGTTARAYWFDPRTGNSIQIGTYATSGTQLFTPPEGVNARTDDVGRDYVLVLDDTSQNYPPPGTATANPTTAFVMAHRGGGRDTEGERPENTLIAFRWAWSNGCNPEGDLDVTSDGSYVFMHDASLDRTTNGTGNTSDSTFAYVRSLDAGNWFHPDYVGAKVPELYEVFAAFASEAPVNTVFSLDPDSTIENAAGRNAIRDALDANGLWTRVFIECSNTTVADAFKATDSRFRLAAYCADQSALTTALAYEHYERLHLNYDLRAQIGSVHDAGKTAIVNLDGVNSFDYLCNVLNDADEPPDGINTDRPKFMKTLTDALGKGV